MAEGVVAGSSQVSLTESGVGCCHASARYVVPVFSTVQSSSDCSCLLPTLDPNNCNHQPLLDAQLCPQAGVGNEALLAGDEQVPESGLDEILSQSSEEMTGEDIDNDPMLFVLQNLLEEKDTQHHVSSLAQVQRAFLFDFLDLCWTDVSELTKEKFKSSFSVEMDNLNSSSGAYFEALRLLVVATSSKPHIDSLSTERKQLIFSFFCFLLKWNTNFSSDRYSNLNDLVAGLLLFDNPNRSQWLKDRCDEELHNNDCLVQEGTWVQVKSRSKRKAASKNAKSSSGSKAIL